jgi:hypothetical protein
MLVNALEEYQHAKEHGRASIREAEQRRTTLPRLHIQHAG